MTIKVKIEGRDYDFGSEAHVAKLEDIQNNLRLDAKAAVEKLQAETRRADKAEGQLDELKASVEKIRTDAAEQVSAAQNDAAASDEMTRERRRHRRKMERIALRYFGDDTQADDKTGGAAPTEPDGDENTQPSQGQGPTAASGKPNPFAKKQMSKRDFPPGAKAPPFRKEDGGAGPGGPPAAMQENQDAFEERIDSMSDREVMVFCLKKNNENFDDAGKSDDYLAARFDSMVETLQSERGITGVVNAARRGAQNLDANYDADDVVSKARAKRDADMRDAWKPKQTA
jgi:hypothetical protein